MRRVFKYALPVVVAVVVTGVWAVRDDMGLGRNMEIMVNMMRELSLQYVDEVKPDKLMSDGAQGMVRNLDPYTHYMSEEEMNDFELMATGKYGGIGATIRMKRDSSGVVIAQPYKGSPSDLAGLKIFSVIFSAVVLAVAQERRVRKWAKIFSAK